MHEEYKKGSTIRELGTKYKIHYTSIYDAFRLSGLEVGLTESDHRRKLTLEDEADICDLYFQGMTMRELAEQFEVVIQTINKILIKNKVQKRVSGPGGMRKNTRGQFVR